MGFKKDVWSRWVARREKQLSRASREEKAGIILRVWRSHKEYDLPMLVRVHPTYKRVLEGLSRREGRLRHVYQYANAISFAASYDFGRDFLESIMGKPTSLRKAYPNLFENIYDIMPVYTLEKPPVRKARKQDLWNLDMVRAREAQTITKGEGVLVGVIDTGVDYTHPEVKHAFDSEKGVNIPQPGKQPMDKDGHGTHVAGIIAGREVGVAPGVQLYAIRVFDGPYAFLDDVIAGIDWSIQKGVDVINMSLGSPTYDRTLDEIIQAAVQHGIIPVAAAGNSRRGRNYPASLENVISVAAVDQLKQHAEFSNICETNDLSAPGVSVYSSIPGGKYASYSGTSMATPHVTAGVALVKSRKPHAPIEEILKETAQEAQPVPGENYEDVYGAGILDAYAALNHSQHARTLLKRLGRSLLRELREVIF